MSGKHLSVVEDGVVGLADGSTASGLISRLISTDSKKKFPFLVSTVHNK